MNSIGLYVEDLFFNREADKNFYNRCLGNGDLSKYKRRLENIGFTDMEYVLDMGCGFGQWTISLAELNEVVLGTDLDGDRLSIASEIKKNLKLENLEFSNESTSNLISSKGSGSFDGIFSYNTIPLTPWREELKILSLLMAKGGLLYFNAYDLGWICHNLIETHNTSLDFDSREWAINSIINTLEYERTGTYKQSNTKSSLFVPQKQLLEYLPEVNLEILHIGGDGEIVTSSSFAGHEDIFFPGERFGIPAVYEVLCKKI